MSDALILIDTDSAIALAHSDKACQLISESPCITVTKTVWNELTDSRKQDENTRREAERIEQVLSDNPAPVPVSQDTLNSAGGSYNYGEQGIRDYLEHGDRDVSTVLFFDNDLAPMSADFDTKFFPYTKIFDIYDTEKEEAIEEALKTAKARGWTAKPHLQRLLVRADLISGAEYVYADVMVMRMPDYTDL